MRTGLAPGDRSPALTRHPPSFLVCRLLLAALCVTAAAPACALDFKDGRWRISIETEQRGIAEKIPPKYEYEHCLTQKDFKPDLTPLNAGCRITDSETDGDEVTWRFACRHERASVYGYAKLEFSGTRFRGTLTTISDAPERFEIVQKLRGRYLRACSRDEPRRQPARPSQGPLRNYEEIR